MLRVFLSSTFADLEAERGAVEAGIQRMDARYIGMEHFGSFHSAPLDKCLEHVRSADAVVLLLGGRYGHAPENSSVSFTEAEYREAVKNAIPVLPYLQEDQKTIWSSPSKRPRAEERLIALREELKAKHGVTWFSTPEDLAWKVASDLAREFSHLLRPDAPPAEDISEAILADPLRDRIEELVEILSQRAKRIRLELQDHFQYAAVRDFIREFDELHQRHIDSLRACKIILAHDILLDIHELFSNLSRKAELFREKRFSFGTRYTFDWWNAFRRGPSICAYVAGDIRYYRSFRVLKECLTGICD
jgi:hypothetical protein